MLRTALVGWIWLAGTVASCVTPVPAGPLLGKANYNDLDGRSLVFQPEGDAYRVLVRAAGAIAANRGTQLAAGGFVNDAWAPGLRIPLPFGFPFAGRKG